MNHCQDCWKESWWNDDSVGFPQEFGVICFYYQEVVLKGCVFEKSVDS